MGRSGSSSLCESLGREVRVDRMKNVALRPRACFLMYDATVLIGDIEMAMLAWSLVRRDSTPYSVP